MGSRTALAAVLFLTFGVTPACTRRVEPRDPYAAEIAPLVEAFGAKRPLEARLTGGFPYSVWRQMRGAEHPLQLDAAVARLEQIGASDRAKAIGALLSGDEDAAIGSLERLVSRSRRFASVASDLAAAHLVRWQHSGAALDAARALDAADRAIGVDPQIREAWFNRGLALDALGASALASEGWRKYTDLEKAGGWAKEASERASRDERALMEAVAPVAERPPHVVREDLETGVFSTWLARTTRASGEDGGWRSRRELAHSLETRTGDPLWSDVARELDAVRAARQPVVANALRALIAARLDLEANRAESAAHRLGGVAASLVDVPSAQLFAEFWTQYARWYSGETAHTIAALTRLRREAAARHFAYLAARCSLVLAASFERLAQYDEAAIAFRAAIDTFSRLQEVELAASAESMFAQLLCLQGDVIDGWEHAHAALQALPAMASSRQRVIVLANVVLIGAHHGLPYASLDLQSALISEVRSWQDPGALARYDIERARLCNDVGLVNEAHYALSDGRRILRQISDPSNRAIFESDLEIEEARAMIGTSPQEAARILANVVDSMRARTGEFKLAEVLLDLGRARQRAGDARGALTAWLAGIDTFERQRQAISGEALRIGFYSRAWELYDYAIAEALSERDDRAALSLVERSRARALRDAVDPFGRPVDIGEVQSRLSLGTALLTFAIVRGSLLAWCIDRSHVTFAQLAYGADALQEEVQALRREILERGSMQSAARFTRAINAAFGSQLDTATRIVVVPDGPLSGVPFSALPWKDGRQAVDHFSVSLAPSLSVFERASRDLSSIAGSPPKRAALIGDPTIDRRLYPSLNQLPSARREVIESARWYPRSRIFVGAAATASRVTEAIGSADVIHFAGHAIANPDFPLKAALVVAPDGNRPGHMRPSDLKPRRNSRTRLVILSACSTAQATPVFGEGALSLARPFLAAGVPDVLGTIWDVDDGDAAALVPRFHRWLRMGIEPAEALRRAQLELKTGPDPSLRAPRAWSGFVIIGGSYLHNMSSSR